MSAKMVSKPWKSSMFIVSAYRVHRDSLLTGVAKITERPIDPTDPTDPLDESTTPSVTASGSFFFQPETTSIEEAKEKAGWYLDSIVDTIELRARAMVMADEANLANLDAASALREDRDQITDELGRLYVRQRDAVMKLYNPRTAWEAGFEQHVEQEPVRLVLQVERAINSLTSGKLVWGQTLGKVIIDPIKYGKEMEAPLTQLKEIMAGINGLVRETQGTTVAKNQAIQAFKDTFTPGAQSIESAFRLAGMVELGDRVKPSTRRPGRLADEVEGEGEGEPIVEPDFGALGIEPPADI